MEKRETKLENMRQFKSFYFIPRVLGIICGFITLYVTVSTFIFIHSSASYILEGKVVAYKEYMRYNEDIIGCVIEAPFNEDTVRIISRAFKNPTYLIGDKVELIYAPKLNDLRINTHMETWGSSYLFLVFGMFFIILPIMNDFFIYLYEKKYI